MDSQWELFLCFFKRWAQRESNRGRQSRTDGTTQLSRSFYWEFAYATPLCQGRRCPELHLPGASDVHQGKQVCRPVCRGVHLSQSVHIRSVGESEGPGSISSAEVEVDHAHDITCDVH